jgi:hypothetical protein
VLNRTEQIQLVQEFLLDVNHRSTDEFLGTFPMHVYVGSGKAKGSNWSGIVLDMMLTPPVFDLVVELYQDLRQRIMNLASEYRRPLVLARLMDLREDAEIMLDLDSCTVLIQAMREVMRGIQMPARNRELDAKWEAFGAIMPTPESIVGALQLIQRTVWVTELDQYNVRILKTSRTMHDNGMIWIEQRFQELLASGTITMERTLAWVSAAFRSGMASGAVALSELRPITTTVGVVKLLYVGFDILMFGDDLLNNECDFPETLLLDVWRFCALQRKIRVDIAAVVVLIGLEKLLEGRPDAKDTLGKVAAILLQVKYGVRGLHDDGLYCQCGKQLQERLVDEMLMLKQVRGFDQLIAQCDNVKCLNFQQT